MVAFNFKKDFRPSIEDGDKCSTIRVKKRCNVGDKMQLFTGQRTKNCEKFAEVECTGVAKISISDECPWAITEQEGVVLYKTRLHEQEGFINAKEFIEFFKNHYGLPFEGYIHAWKPIEPSQEG